MSGFEVAGVVLGSIPLIISALEHYADGLSTIRSMRKYEDVFGHMHASFVTIACIYRNSCEDLLCPLALSDIQLYQLLEKHDSPSWESVELNDALRSRLGSSYVPFKLAVKQLNKGLRLLGRKLQLCDDFRPPWTTPTGNVDIHARDRFFNDPWVRIKGGFKSKPYQKLLSSIEEDVDRVSRLTAGAISLEPMRLQRKRKANTDSLVRFRGQAEKLYDAINSRWSSKCMCTYTHQANLCLDFQADYEKRNHSTFKLVFTFETSIPGTTASWQACPVEIETVDIATATKPGNGSLIPSIIIHTDKVKQHHWDCLERAPSINNLCTALKSFPNSDCIGVLHSKFAQHHLHTLRLPTASRAEKRHSLQELLEAQGTAFHVNDKCTLALTLASAVYYLHDTPWLEETWDLNDICILNSSVLSDQTYISREFPSNPKPTASSQRIAIIKNSIVFALGVALLEMSYGKPIQTFEIADDLESGRRTIFTDFLIAQRLANGLRTRELPNYATAVQRCVLCNFETSEFSLDDDDFRERFYQGVLVPLKKDYEYVIAQTTT